MGEINKKLNDLKNNNNNTMYSIPDATKLYHQMDHFENNTKLIQQINDLEEKYSVQSRQCMQLKLENQSLKNTNLRIKKDSLTFSDKLRVSINEKNKLFEELQSIKSDHNSTKKQCINLRKEVIKKNNDIQRL